MNQRLRLIEPQAADARVVALFRQVDAPFGGVPNLFTALAHKPAVLDATLTKVARVMDEGELGRTLKEMMAVVVELATKGCHRRHTKCGLPDAEATARAKSAVRCLCQHDQDALKEMGRGADPGTYNPTSRRCRISRHRSNR